MDAAARTEELTQLRDPQHLQRFEKLRWSDQCKDLNGNGRPGGLNQTKFFATPRGDLDTMCIGEIVQILFHGSIQWRLEVVKRIMASNLGCTLYWKGTLGDLPPTDGPCRDVQHHGHYQKRMARLYVWPVARRRLGRS
eukprot:Gb_20173 [translate_table: standard]